MSLAQRRTLLTAVLGFILVGEIITWMDPWGCFGLVLPFSSPATVSWCMPIVSSVASLVFFTVLAVASGVEMSVQPIFDFRGAWASNLTVFGVLLGTAASLLGKGQLSNELAGLNFLFGLTAPVATLAYLALAGRPDARKFNGWTFLISSFLTMVAAWGQLLTLLRMVVAVQDQGNLSVASFWVFVVLVYAGALLLGIFAWKKAHQLLTRTPQQIQAFAALPGAQQSLL